jgi:hypothetical protein
MAFPRRGIGFESICHSVGLDAVPAGNCLFSHIQPPHPDADVQSRIVPRHPFFVVPRSG